MNLEKLQTCLPLEERPAILFLGSSSVGKRTLLSRLLASSSSSVDFDDDDDDATPQLLAHGWTIDNKYYTADVSVWTADLVPSFSLPSLPFSHRLAALVMVFDISDLSSLAALQDWVSQTDIHQFDILLCVANKVDRLPGHPVHFHYRSRLHKKNLGESSPHTFVDKFGISESEATSLLGDEDPSLEIRRSCLQWCTDRNIEFIEACASNADFDKCLSIDGDSQGVERLCGALSAHMWPGMILKSGNKTTAPSLLNKDELSEEESDYELEYEVLSAGSAELWDDAYGEWTSAAGTSSVPDLGGSTNHDNSIRDHDYKDREVSDGQESKPSAQGGEVVPSINEPDKILEPGEVSPFDFEDLEQLMSEIGNMRDNLRLMPDFQRREMAANLAMKMAAMFGGGSDDEEDPVDELHTSM